MPVVKNFPAKLRRAISGPQALACVPALALVAFWLGGEGALILVALGVPIVAILTGANAPAPKPKDPVVVAGDFITQIQANVLASAALMRARKEDMATACFVIDIDGLDMICERSGKDVANSVRDLSLSRLRNVLRNGDEAFRLSDTRFVAFGKPSPRLDLEALLQVSMRIQSAMEEPLELDNNLKYLAVSIGFCSSQRLPETAEGTAFFDAAHAAVEEAVANGPSAVRAWSDGMRAARSAQKSLLSDVERALANGQIQPWFQPQICTSTGDVTGVEALARWIHPERGIIPPAQFLRCLEEAGRMHQLNEVIMQHSLTALRSWDQAGLDIPRVSVNFSDVELRDPKLVQRIQWELDRFGLTAPRLGIEVLETVIAGSPEGIVSRNISALGALGCHLDLDDFGTGHASITALRRFPVHRLKIDRSFVTRVDRDEEQRRMLAAILGMSERLGLETLAEGVETVGEHALLAQLGCHHVQGFGIGRPMPADQMAEWTTAHSARISDAQNLGRSTG